MKFRRRGITQKNEYKSITYSECVFVTLFIQHAMFLRQTLICGLPFLRNFFPNCLINGTIFKEKVTERKIYFNFPYNFCPKQW